MRWPIVIGFVMAVLASGATIEAQWLNYPTRGIPRLPDGKPDLSAPAPRTPDGKPDFSGIWQLQPDGPCPVLACGGDYTGAREFTNIGAKLPDGLPYRPATAELVKQRRAQIGRDDPVGFCKPGGPVRILTFPPPRKILQLPDLLVILSERDVTYRQLFLDGRPLPEDPSPTPNGYSTGRWEGDTLVVQTNGLREGTWLDRIGSPISEAAKMTERFRRVNFGLLEIDLTIDDLKEYTKPWTVTLRQRLVVDTELLDYYCTDNERDAAHMAGK
jgi:hypothetical protein